MTARLALPEFSPCILQRPEARFPAKMFGALQATVMMYTGARMYFNS